MTKSPKKRIAKTIEKRNEELERKRREKFYVKNRYLVAEYRSQGWSMRKIATKLDMSLGFVQKWCRKLV
jgi:hypothetical protein